MAPRGFSTSRRPIATKSTSNCSLRISASSGEGSLACGSKATATMASSETKRLRRRSCSRARSFAFEVTIVDTYASVDRRSPIVGSTFIAFTRALPATSLAKSSRSSARNLRMARTARSMDALTYSHETAVAASWLSDMAAPPVLPDSAASHPSRIDVMETFSTAMSSRTYQEAPVPMRTGDADQKGTIRRSATTVSIALVWESMETIHC